MQFVGFAHQRPPTRLLGSMIKLPFLISSSTDHIPVTRNSTLAQHRELPLFSCHIAGTQAPLFSEDEPARVDLATQGTVI